MYYMVNEPAIPRKSACRLPAAARAFEREDAEGSFRGTSPSGDVSLGGLRLRTTTSSLGKPDARVDPLRQMVPH